MLALVERSPGGDGDGPPVVPAVYRGTEGSPGPVLFTPAGVRPGLVEGRRGAAVVRGADLDELAAGVAVQRVGVIVDRHAVGGAWRRVMGRWRPRRDSPL